MLRFQYRDAEGKIVKSGQVECPMDNAVEIVRVFVFPFMPDVETAEIRNMPGDAIWFRRLHRPTN